MKKAHRPTMENTKNVVVNNVVNNARNLFSIRSFRFNYCLVQIV